MIGEWYIDVTSAADEDGAKLVMVYPESKLESAFATSEMHKYGPFKDTISLKCVRSSDNCLDGALLSPKSTLLPEYKLILKSHPGKGLNLHHHTDIYGGHDVLWAQLCDASQAMSILVEKHENGLFMRIS